MLWHWGDNGSFKGFVMADTKTKSGVVMFANSEKGLEVAKPVVDEVMGRGSLAFEWLKIRKPLRPLLSQRLHRSKPDVCLPRVSPTP